MANAENCTMAELDTAIRAAASARSAQRMTAMRALLVGLSRADVGRVFRITSKTLSEWIHRFVKWKDEHEKRIAIVAGVNPTKEPHVILYGANIGDQTSKLQSAAAEDALFPDWYPAEERPIHLSMSWEGKDSDPAYWEAEAKNLKTAFNRQIRPLVDGAERPHFSLFALAPIPLMTRFGSLLTGQAPAQTYQLHREPFQTWKWLTGPSDFAFQINRPASSARPPARVISLSDHIAPSRITADRARHCDVRTTREKRR